MKKTDLDALIKDIAANNGALATTRKLKRKLRDDRVEKDEAPESAADAVQTEASDVGGDAPMQVAQADTAGGASGASGEATAEPAGAPPAGEAAGSVAAGESTAGGIGLGGLALGGLVLGGVAVAMAGGGSGGNSAATPAAGDNNIITGTVTAGPVLTGNGLKVEVFKADGLTKLGESVVDGSGQFTVSIGAYTGVVIARLVDADGGADYQDEATAGAKDLNATLLATSVVNGGTVTLNINPLTTIAAQKAGLAADGSGSLANPTAVTNANAAVASAFGVTDLTGTTVVPTNGGDYTPADGLSAGEQYGVILAALSGADLLNGGNSQTTIANLVAAIAMAGATGALSAGGQAAVIAGATVVDPNVEGDARPAVGNILAGNSPADQTTALAKIANYADSPANPAPTVVNYAAAGITGVIAGNLTAVNGRIAAVVKTAADQVAEIQALVAPATPAINAVATDDLLNAGEADSVITGGNEAGATVTVNIGGNSRAASVSGTSWSYTLTAADLNAMGQGAETLSVTQTDAAGNISAAGSHTVSIDTLAPAASIVVTDTALKAGETSQVTITFNEAVTGFTNADLAIANGAMTDVASTDGGITWTATFTPAADTTDASNLITLADASVSDAAGNANSGATDSNNYTIDTLAPTVSSVAISSADGIQNSTLNAGDLVRVTVTMSEATTVTGTPQLGLNIGGTTVQADYASGSGSDELIFTYTIQAGQTDANGISIDAGSLGPNGGTIRDAAGNDAVLTHNAVADNAGYLVDTTAPAFSSETTASVVENTATSVTVYDATADGDSGVAYTIGGLFDIHASTGAVSFKAVPDYETSVDGNGDNIYDFTVTATDGAGNATGQDVALTVTDEAEGAYTLGQAVIDLGDYGLLIAPVEVDGKW